MSVDAKAQWGAVVVAVVTGISGIVIALIQTGFFDADPDRPDEVKATQTAVPDDTLSAGPSETDAASPSARATPSGVPLSDPAPQLVDDEEGTDWDGEGFDFGRPLGTRRLPSGEVGLVLDRYTVTVHGARIEQATDFEREPVVAFFEADVIENQNPRTRSFVLDPDVEVLVLANHAEGCADSSVSARWAVGPLDLLAAPDGWFASLVYGGQGQIEQIRFTAGC